MKKNVIFLFFLFQFGYGFCQKTQSNLVRNGYADSLRKIMKVIKEGRDLKIKSIEFCFPQTNSESALFYHLDYKKENSKSFGILENRIRELAFGGHLVILKKYLMLSEFVDGYFAEAYFDDVEGLMEKKPELFCKTIKELPKDKIMQLSELRKKANCR
jgi:hypothetical protein